MNEENFRLYVGKEISHYRTIEETKEAAKVFMHEMPELRIEILMEIDPGKADWLAFNYETKEWEPS